MILFAVLWQYVKVLRAPNSGGAFVEALPQALALLGAEVWVRHDKIGGLGV